MSVSNKILFVVSLMILFLFGQTASAQQANAITAEKGSVSGLSSEKGKSELYSKFRDRRCTSMTIDKCDCPDAREMRAYIDALIEMGADKDEIFFKVAKKFTPNTIVDEKMKARVEARLIKETKGKRPQIILEPISLNFGEVSKKEGQIEKIFKLYNKGNDRLIITNIKVSCSCVTVSLVTGENKSPYFGIQGAPSGWQAVIEPGKSGELQVIVDLNHPSIAVGKLIRDITINSNDIINPEVSLRIEGEVTN